MVEQPRESEQPPEVVREGALTEDEERRRVAEAGGHGHLVAWERWNPEDPPLVLVHGIKDAPASLLPLARAFAPTHQVFFFLYDDVGVWLDRTADDLARGLVVLHQWWPETPVAVVAHSMGGVVSRGALNSLVHPNWFPTHHAVRATAEVEPVLGAAEAIRLDQTYAHHFEQITLVTLDTPWHGFIDAPIPVRNRFAQSSVGDMVASGAYFSALYSVRWPDHFAIDYIEAHNQECGEARDRILGLAELVETDAERLLRALLDDATPEDAMLRNGIAALRQERDYGRLVDSLRRERDTLDARRLRAILDDSVTTLAATHVSLVSHPELEGCIRTILGRGRS